MPAWLSSLRKTVPASFRSTQLRRPGSIPVRKKKKQATANTGEKKEEREGGKKRVAHPKLDCVRTRDGGLDVKGWRESAVSLAEFDQNGFGYVSACCYDSFLCCFEGEKNFRRPFSPAGNPPRIINWYATFCINRVNRLEEDSRFRVGESNYLWWIFASNVPIISRFFTKDSESLAILQIFFRMLGEIYIPGNGNWYSIPF